MISSRSRKLIGGHVVVEDDHVRFVKFDELFDFFRFTRADESRWINPVAILHDALDNFRAGGFGQARKLAKRVARIGRRIGQDDADQNRFLGADGQFQTFIL